MSSVSFTNYNKTDLSVEGYLTVRVLTPNCELGSVATVSISLPDYQHCTVDTTLSKLEISADQSCITGHMKK